MEILNLVVTFFTTGFMADFFTWLLGLLAFWGAGDLYMLWRMRRNGKMDQTASLWNWFNLKWCIASQTDLVAEKLPFITKDLSEVVGVKKDDGRIT
jgi:hypothetical protein